MKKLLATLLALTMLLGTLMLASCGMTKPELDLKEAEKALEDAKYTVAVKDDKDELKEYMPGLVEMLSARSEDGKDSIQIYVFDNAKTAKLFYQQLKMSYDQQIEAMELEIKFYEYVLDEYEKDLTSDEINEYKDELKELEKELEEYKDDYTFGRDGKTVWTGSVKAAEASKK